MLKEPGDSFLTGIALEVRVIAATKLNKMQLSCAINVAGPYGNYSSSEVERQCILVEVSVRANHGICGKNKPVIM